MSTPPDGILLERHLEPLSRVVWFRRMVLLALVALLVVAFAGLLGQRPRTSVADAPAASLRVEAPTTLRGGLLFEGRFTVEARRRLEHATLVLDDGWLDQMSVNTIEPSPVSEESRDGRLALDFGRLEPGQRLVVYLQFQVNPTNVGRRSQDVALADRDRTIASVDRTVTVLP